MVKTRTARDASNGSSRHGTHATVPANLPGFLAFIFTWRCTWHGSCCRDRYASSFKRVIAGHWARGSRCILHERQAGHMHREDLSETDENELDRPTRSRFPRGVTHSVMLCSVHDFSRVH